MYRLLVISLSFISAIAFAHTDAVTHDAALGEEARAIKAEGKTYHEEGISVIRKMHPEFLNHKRDKTLRQGVRTQEYSLKGCVNCHANKDTSSNTYHPVNEKDQFCSDCHEQVSVSMDCFSCHRTTPGKGAK